MSNRVDAGTALRTSYRMSLKTVAGEQLTRLDLSLIRQEARRLALDMSENGGGHLTLDIPSHFFRLKDEGLVADEALVFGNPADLSYTETIIEVYNDIKINNSLDESLFRLLLE